MGADQSVFEAAARECAAGTWAMAAGRSLSALEHVLRAIVFLYNRDGTEDVVCARGAPLSASRSVA
jgi:hypothetical protein